MRKAIHELKSRISGSSVLQHGSSPDVRQLLYQTNSLTVHKGFDNVQAPDQAKIAAQKLRLSKSNFHMGQSYPVYNTSHQLQHDEKKGQYYGKEFRQKALEKNTTTNFVHPDGFEKHQRAPSLGPMPHKGEVDKSGLAE